MAARDVRLEFLYAKIRGQEGFPYRETGSEALSFVCDTPNRVLVNVSV